MIILEGVDNSGKSTLGKILEKKLELTLIHSTKPEGTQEDVYWHCIEQLSSLMIIRDRITAISEMVYGPILRGGSALGRYHAPVLYELLNKDYLIINCRPPNRVILNNSGREQMEGVIAHHEELIQGYDKVMLDLRRFGACKVIDYDWTNPASLCSVLSACNIHYEKQRERILSTKFLTGDYGHATQSK